MRREIAVRGFDAVRPAAQSRAPDLTLDAGIGRWWSEIGAHQRAAKDREAQLQIWLELLKPRTLMGEITTAKIAKAVIARRAMRLGKAKREISPATMNRFIAALRRVWRYLDSDEAPLPRIKWGEFTAPEGQPRVRVLSADQRRRLREAAAAAVEHSHRRRPVRADWAPLFADVLALYGLRMGEMFFPPSALDAEERTLTVKKWSRKRPTELVVRLTALHARQLAARAARARAAGLKHVWYYDRGRGLLEPITRGNANGILRRALAAAQIRNFTLHDLRHHSGSTLMRETGNLAAVKEALGHASIQSTLRYTHVSPDVLANAFESISRNSAETPRAKRKKAE